MDEREKIIEIIAPFVSAYGADEAIADALIAAGIGDVTAWKERAEKHRVQVLPDGTIKQLYGDEEVEDIARQRDEYKHRAEVAERALRKYIRKVSCSRCPYAMSCDIFPPTPKNDYIECFDEVLRLEEEE